MKLIRGAFFALVVVALLALPAATPDTLGFRVYREAYKDYFNVLGWMAGQLTSAISGGQDNLPRPETAEAARSESDLVKSYLKLNEQIAAATPPASSHSQPADEEGVKKLVEERDRLEPQAQAILRKQVEETLQEAGFTSTVVGRTGIFPPPLFAFTPLPKVLVVSPRDRIVITNTLALKPTLTWSEADALEQRLSKMNLSALVVPIGGLGAYPPMIPRTSSIEFLAHTIPHEWMHNYLTLRPLGFRYSLQIEKDYDVVTMNETAASIVGDEVGDLILSKYYGYPAKQHPVKPEPKSESQQPQPPVETDFTKRMRAIRVKVDDYLSKGMVDDAEKYMAGEQVKLQADGYDVRKLNQAYFAFYGSYATSPGFTNPLGDAVAELRYESPSLKAFIDEIGQMHSYTKLKKSLKEPAQ